MATPGDAAEVLAVLVVDEVARIAQDERRLREATELRDAQERLVRLLQLPIASEPTEALALGAVPRALAAGMSGYDALYLVLADATNATLVTADRRIAEASLARLGVAARPGAVIRDP